MPLPLHRAPFAVRHGAVGRVAVLVALLGAPSGARLAGAQPLPGAQPSEAARGYADLVRARIDSALRRWEQAADAKDTTKLARLYAPSAALYPAFGNAIQGRRAITDALGGALVRMERPRFSVERVTASGDLAAVVADLTYQMRFPTGGSYERRERVQLAMRPEWNAGWVIEMQSGGDLAPTVDWAERPRARLTAGDTATLRVRVTDALGGGIADVLVSFAADEVAGIVSPASARTNAKGEASALLVAGSAGGAGEVRATAAIAPSDPALAVVTTVPGTHADTMPPLAAKTPPR